MTAESPMLEIAALIAEAGGKDLDACMQCGTCTAVCPWPLVDDFSPRRLIRQASLGLAGWESAWSFRCVTCRACVPRCPRGLDITEIMRAARCVLQDSGSAPRALGGPLASLRAEGNPWEGEAGARQAWMDELGVPAWHKGCDTFWIPCCTQVHDPRNRRASGALAALLRLAGVAFGTTGQGLQCCGDQARKVGAQDVYEALWDGNRGALAALDGAALVVSSPHCLDVLEHQGLSGEHEVQLLWRLVERGRLVPIRTSDAVVTYHDPCYLGRYAGVYDAPRRLLTRIPGLELREMPRNREESLCCGGGGGGLWMELPLEQRFAVHRVREALDTGATMLATACPYCVLMFEDAVKVLELEDRLAIRTVDELLLASLEDAQTGGGRDD